MNPLTSFFIPNQKFTHDQLTSLQDCLVPDIYNNFVNLVSEYLEHPDSRLFISFRESKTVNGKSCLLLDNPPLQQTSKVDPSSWWLLVATPNPNLEFHKFRVAMCTRIRKLIRFKLLSFRFYPQQVYSSKIFGIGCGLRGLNSEERADYDNWSKKYFALMGSLRTRSNGVVSGTYSQEIQGKNDDI